jgi:hypothetical protein
MEGGRGDGSRSACRTPVKTHKIRHIGGAMVVNMAKIPPPPLTQIFYIAARNQRVTIELVCTVKQYF